MPKPWPQQHTHVHLLLGAVESDGSLANAMHDEVAGFIFYR